MDEKRYALQEARLELARRECRLTGHEWRVLERLGVEDPHGITCERCGKYHRILADGETATVDG